MANYKYRFHCGPTMAGTLLRTDKVVDTLKEAKEYKRKHPGTIFKRVRYYGMGRVY